MSRRLYLHTSQEAAALRSSCTWTRRTHWFCRSDTLLISAQHRRIDSKILEVLQALSETAGQQPIEVKELVSANVPLCCCLLLRLVPRCTRDC